MDKILVNTFLVLLQFSFVLNGLFPKNPVIFSLKNMEDCPYEGNFSVYLTKKMLSRSRAVYDANVTLPFPLDENIIVRIHVSRWGDGGWKYNAFRLEKHDPCPVLNMLLGDYWHKLQEQIKMPKGKCPVPAGFYSGRDINGDMGKEGFPVRSIFSGRIKVQIEFEKFEKIVACKLLYLTGTEAITVGNGPSIFDFSN